MLYKRMMFSNIFRILSKRDILVYLFDFFLIPNNKKYQICGSFCESRNDFGISIIAFIPIFIFIFLRLLLLLLVDFQLSMLSNP